MVVHLCCSVDAGYFLKRLKEVYPDEKLIGFFYDPNIHPYSEFKLRAFDTKRICEKEGVEFIEGEYDYLTWYKKTKGLENEPEKGRRCNICFDISLEKSAQLAKELGEKRITTSLLLSPKKSHSQLEAVGKVIKRKYGIEFINIDFRKGGGTQAQQLYARDNQLYRQDYCGCLYGIWQQKSNQEIIDELVSPYPFQILPGSIEEKLNFYKKRVELEELKIEYKIEKENFLNYRLLNSLITCKKKPIFHYTLFYSYLKKPQRVRVEFEKEGIFYANRAQVIFIKPDGVNRILKRDYKSVKEMFLDPLTIDEELKLRENITSTFYNLSPIIVVDEIKERFDITINAKIYPDSKEILIKF